jgi:hypothetical protein
MAKYFISQSNAEAFVTMNVNVSTFVRYVFRLLKTNEDDKDPLRDSV